MSALAVALALAAAALFAVAAAAQQRSAAAVPDDRSSQLVLTLVRRPLWWVGTLADVGGYVAQAAALGLGSLLLVQPLLVTGLLFALPLGARWAGRSLGRAELVWSALLVAALAVFVVSGEPTAGVDRAGLREWAPAAIVLGPVLGACLIGAAARRGTVRAVLLAVATGLLYGVGAALTKGVVGPRRSPWPGPRPGSGASAWGDGGPLRVAARFPHGGSLGATRCPVPPGGVVLGRHVPRRHQPTAGDDRMTQSQHPPIDPDTVAEIAPGEGAEPGSTYYGGSEIHDDHVGEGAEAAGDSAAGEPVAGESVTTEAGTFEDLPVTADEQIE